MRGARGYKWKILDAAMSKDTVSSRDFAEVTGLPTNQTSPYALELERGGYLVLKQEVPLERGGRPMKIYTWTGKMPPVHDTVRARFDRTIADCFNSMVRCRETGDGFLACAL